MDVIESEFGSMFLPCGSSILFLKQLIPRLCLLYAQLDDHWAAVPRP